MKLVRQGGLVLLAIGGILWVFEGTMIGLGRVWFSAEAPLLFRLMLPAIFLGFAIVLGLTALSSRSKRQAVSVQSIDRPQAQA